ncbi:MBL fold metallo-hydrolase [Pelomonas sp. SE-A7]|uniref:MBL fold metallo-hydrolase n=1 Tax=Pelomonas sp. SE-A7 TaxID=3054953 RepID=UPI00259CC0BE|nr:MBL fold metallo-hydrolase [Pelomonas sp. SE-A7]MDM4765640.1 MBL fold metallo-hydrolase [Pelomonas sp. SE-A7]
MLIKRLLAGGLAALLALSAGAQVLTPVQVAPRAWMVQGESALGSSANRNFISNAAFVVTDEGVLVVDALGSPALAEELLTAIRRITDKPLRYVVVTHYHADHIYGLQVLKAAGAQVIAQTEGQAYLHSETANLRLKASRQDLFPWIDEQTQLVAADRWIAQPTTLKLGGLDFLLQPAGPAHTPEDLVVYVPQLKLLLAGDLVFRGRVPFVGQADSGRWIAGLDQLLGFGAEVIVPGHGPLSTTARADLQLTRDYLAYLRKTMGEAARDMEPFEEAYKRADWSRFEKLPLFGAANRINAYNTYLLMEREGR